MSGSCRILSVVVLLLGGVFAFSAGAGADSITPPHVSYTGAGPKAAAAPTPDEYSIVRAMNAVRVANGVAPLRVGSALSRAAHAHSVDMARKGYFDHGAFVQRLRRFGVRAPFIGENIASATGPMAAAAIVQMWVASPPHRQNLLNRGFQRVGVGVAGSSTRMVTADFAGR
jgi:uncharacterized protein YkwD